MMLVESSISSADGSLKLISAIFNITTLKLHRRSIKIAKNLIMPETLFKYGYLDRCKCLEKDLPINHNARC